MRRSRFVQPEPPKNLHEIVSVRLTAEDIDALNRMVRQSDRTASDIIRDALREYLNSMLGVYA